MSYKKCPYCSEEILSEAKKCKHCGEFLDPKLKAGNQKTEIQVTQKSSNLLTIFLVLGIIALCVVLFGV